MFIATTAHSKDLAPLGAIASAEAAKTVALLRSFKSKEGVGKAINISPLWGEARVNDLLHFEIEFAQTQIVGTTWFFKTFQPSREDSFCRGGEW